MTFMTGLCSLLLGGVLMALCDSLEQQIDDAAGKQTALLNAVMSQV